MSLVRIPVGGGSPEGENSAYLFPNRGILVDPGPPGDDAWAQLLDGIQGAGVDLDEVDDVFITHWHVDHTGLAVRLAEAADAAISMHVHDAPLVGDYARERSRRLARDTHRLRAWGVPDETVDETVASDHPSPLPDTYPVNGLADGDTLAGLEVIHTPGHTLGHAALAERADGQLLVGDAVLSTYTPNVGGGDTRLDDPLATYRTTLDRIQGLGWTGADEATATLHPGHGTTVAFPDRLETIREHHEARSARVLDVLRGHGPATPWTVATELFGEMRRHHAKMGAGEAWAHLVELRSSGAAELVEAGPDRYDVA